MHDTTILQDVGIAILGAAALGLPAYLARFPLILAYVLAGVLLGSSLGFGLISSADHISILSEIGLVLLMFILGLEINIKNLLQAGRAVITNGITQFAGCALLGALFFSSLGFKSTYGSYGIIYLAVACGLSSTLVVVKILSDQLELDSLASRITLGILVFQDLWAIGFLALQPNLGHLEPLLLLRSLAKITFLVLFSWIVARFILPWVFARIARQPELMLVTAMGWCFGVCGLANSLDLSLEMGALVAGVSVASFPYHFDIAAKISSLRDFFITLFFVALGLQIPKPTPEILYLSVAIVSFVMVSRVLTIFPALYLLKYGNRASLVPAINLSQVSEFSLVLCSIGVGLGHIPTSILSAFVLSLVVTVLFSSFLIPRAYPLYGILNPFLEKIGFKDHLGLSAANSTTPETRNPTIVLLGFFREASSLLEELAQRHPQEVIDRVLVVDYNPEAHHELSKRGIHCKYGDISNVDTLRHLPLSDAEILICTIPDHLLKGISNLKLLRLMKPLAPQAAIIVTAETFESAKEMYREGASYVFLPRLVNAKYLADLLEGLQQGRANAIKEGSLANLRKWKEIIS